MQADNMSLEEVISNQKKERKSSPSRVSSYNKGSKRKDSFGKRSRHFVNIINLLSILLESLEK